MEQTLPTRKTDKAVSITILVMQRLHQNDPTGHLLEKKKGNTFHVCLPGEIRNYEKFLTPKSLKSRYVDDLLDARRLNWKVLEELESDLGQYGFAGQIGQNPTPPGGGMFKVDHLTTIEAPPTMVNAIQIIRYWDKAGTEGAGAYTAGVKMARMRSGGFLVMDVKRGQWGTDKREAIIRAVAEADGRDVAVHIEQEPGSGGKESAEATIKNLSGYACYRDIPTGDKAKRADPFSVQVNIGNVSMLRADWNKAFKDELEMFPNGTFKDQVDSSAACFNILNAKKQVRIIR